MNPLSMPSPCAPQLELSVQPQLEHACASCAAVSAASTAAAAVSVRSARICNRCMAMSAHPCRTGAHRLHGGFDVDRAGVREAQRQWHACTFDERFFETDEHQVVTARIQRDLLARRNVEARDLTHPHHVAVHRHRVDLHAAGNWRGPADDTPVSYTHLTLPTI